MRHAKYNELESTVSNCSYCNHVKELKCNQKWESDHRLTSSEIWSTSLYMHFLDWAKTLIILNTFTRTFFFVYSFQWKPFMEPCNTFKLTSISSHYTFAFFYQHHHYASEKHSQTELLHSPQLWYQEPPHKARTAEMCPTHIKQWQSLCSQDMQSYLETYSIREHRNHNPIFTPSAETYS